MILATWHSRKGKTMETIKRSMVARDFWGGMNRWSTVRTWVILKCQYGQLYACVEARLCGQSFTIQFCYEPKIALKKNETKLHQATQDQCVIKRGIVLKDLFQCQPFFKSLYLNLLQYWSCFMFWCFGCEAYGILAPWLEIKPAPLALEGEVLTTGPPGKSLGHTFKIKLQS